jgi:hypothetical protein
MELDRRAFFERAGVLGGVMGLAAGRTAPASAAAAPGPERSSPGLLRQARPSQDQVVFVHARKGNDHASGSITDPISSLEDAIALASRFDGARPVTITVAPGLYVLSHLAEIKTATAPAAPAEYRIEAAVMPDDPDWQPEKMPVVQSLSLDNSVTQFTHCTGCLVSRSHVTIRGLKFVGNANPDVRYYYPIGRENETYKDLRISQCYFIADRYSTPVQGAVWAHGAGIKVDHCIFHGCKNALILLRSIEDFALTNSIIVGAYEAAVWFGPFKPPFTFRDNIVTGCNYVWLRPENSFPEYVFAHSLITDNANDMGMFTSKGPVPAPTNKHTEIDVRRKGRVRLSEVKTGGLPRDYLHPLADSDGADIPAGIFTKAKR